MEHSPRDQRPLRPLQVRALHFLKKLASRARRSGGKSRDTISPVAIPTQDFQRAHSSVDLLRKPDISRLIGFRAEDSPSPMDADDSSQDAPAGGNSPILRPRRHSAWDSLRAAPMNSTFAGHGDATLFFRDHKGLGNEYPVDDPGKLLAPAPVFLRSNVSVDAVTQAPRDPLTSPEIPQINVPLEPKPDEEAVQNMLNEASRTLGDATPNDASLTTPFVDSPPLTSSDPGSSLEAQPFPAVEEPSSELVQARPPLVPRHSASLPPPFRVTTERGLRLSPSIITRQPMPLLKLPALPPPPPTSESPPRQRVPLRSMPSLSRHGRSNIECQADHENAMLGDSDEDDVDEGDEEEDHADALSVHQSDDEDDEPCSPGPSSTPGLKSSQKRAKRDDESIVESPISPISPKTNLATPNLADCFCSKTYVSSTPFALSSDSLAMYPFSPNIPNTEDVAPRHVSDIDLPIPGARVEKKPSLYRAASRSMINLGSTRRTEQGLHRFRSREVMSSNPTSVLGHSSETQEETEESDTEAAIGRLLRRTSYPSFHPTSDPPPYPTFDPRPKESRIAPREDEGRERLPSYSNSLYLLAIMPRKMEFSSPGVQAKDRKWRRVVCELEGTTFRVYKCPPGASGAGVLGDWWEKRVGVGDVACPNPPRIRKKEEQFERPAKLGLDDEPTTPITPPPSSGRSTSVPPSRHTRQRSTSQSSMATQNTMMSTPRAAKRISGASFLSPFRSTSTARPEASAGESSGHRESRELELLPVDTRDSRSSLSHESTERATLGAQRLSLPPQPRSASRLTFLPTTRVPWRNGEIAKPPKSDLMRAYTLQHAESGLGNDYVKRKNVIRVRLEGEQFLLQAPDIPSVVEWIEGVHAGTNIALDLDERTMPKGPMFPRRRRRRTRHTPAQDDTRPSAPPMIA